MIMIKSNNILNYNNDDDDDEDDNNNNFVVDGGTGSWHYEMPEKETRSTCSNSFHSIALEHSRYIYNLASVIMSAGEVLVPVKVI